MTRRCHHTGAALKTSGVEAIRLAAESDALNLDGDTFEEPLRGQLCRKIMLVYRCPMFFISSLHIQRMHALLPSPNTGLYILLIVLVINAISSGIYAPTALFL
jgi:hypothetical protein